MGLFKKPWHECPHCGSKKDSGSPDRCVLVIEDGPTRLHSSALCMWCGAEFRGDAGGVWTEPQIPERTGD
jgi:hypothetical protein